MIALLIYLISLIINTYIFMYQRATLTISRIIERYSSIGFYQKGEIQIILTPNSLGLLGWISAFGLYGSYILLWFQNGIFWAIVAFILSQIIFAIIPIPSNYFYKLIEKHLTNEIAKSTDAEKKNLYIDFLEKLSVIKKEYKVT